MASEPHDCLNAVLTAREAAAIWGLSRNAVSDACRRGALRGRRSGTIWLVTVADMLLYQRGRYWPDSIPPDMQPALDSALLLMDMTTQEVVE
ncbi:MAG: helix-turn-helix domain-containing protein [Anaerolineae bacterium]|nr:helix-turn-helix domain-containing protein [Anaerolineae bacterium]MCO5195618.1 helix-turn-helix domain-containing protein [Anaerolineae bacterium]